jgi:hypothetical protein
VSIPAHVNDREYQKFAETGEGLVAVRTADDNTILNISGIITEVVLNDTTWTALPATPLATRKTLSIQNPSNTPVKINYSNAVSGYVGMDVLTKGGERTYNIDATVFLYGKSSAGNVTVNVEEAG